MQSQGSVEAEPLGKRGVAPKAVERSPQAAQDAAAAQPGAEPASARQPARQPRPPSEDPKEPRPERQLLQDERREAERPRQTRTHAAEQDEGRLLVACSPEWPGRHLPALRRATSRFLAWLRARAGPAKPPRAP